MNTLTLYMFVSLTLIALASLYLCVARATKVKTKKGSRSNIRRAKCCKFCAAHGNYSECLCQITQSRPTDKYMICDYFKAAGRKKSSHAHKPNPKNKGKQK